MPLLHRPAARSALRAVAASLAAAAVLVAAGAVAVTAEDAVAAPPIRTAAATPSPSTATPPGDPSVPVPATPAGLPSRIEEPAPYVRQSSCDPVAKPGSIALAQLLVATYPGTSYGIARDCGADGIASEHYEGRAVDWMVSVRDPAGAARATSLIAWLLAPDAAGNPFANARRLGVMYLIWDDRIWGSYAADRGWRPYSSCADHPEKAWDTSCHRDHVHLSLSWAGALKRTSWWTGQVAGTDYGPCRPADLNWAAPRTAATPAPCPAYPAVTAPSGAPAGTAVLARYSGAVIGAGSGGPVVRAVQAALGVDTDGSFGPLTGAAVSAFRTARGLPAGTTVEAATWRALLAAAPSSPPSPATSPARPSPGTSGSGADPAPSGTTSRPVTTTGPTAPGTTADGRPVLRYGSSGTAVLVLQKALRVSPASGWFGPVTQQAVRTLQRTRGLPVTGVVDGGTWKAVLGG